MDFDGTMDSIAAQEDALASEFATIERGDEIARLGIDTKQAFM